MIGPGVGAAPSMNCDWLGMPFVKTVTKAYPMGKPLELVVIRVIGVEVKEVSDQPAVVSQAGKASVRSSGSVVGSADSWTKIPDSIAARSFGDAFEA